MLKYKIYLDNCCFNRPYDDQSFIVIKLETEAKLYIQDKIKEGQFELFWSYMIDYENSFNLVSGKRILIERWKLYSRIIVEENQLIIDIIDELEKLNITGKDAVHIACAISENVDYFITTDYKLIRKCAVLPNLKAVNPIDFVKLLEAKDENY